MKKKIFILLIAPAWMLGQTCKSYTSFNGHGGTSDFSSKEFSKGCTLTVGGDCGELTVYSYEFTMDVKGKITSYVGKGPELTEKMKTALGSVTKGSKVYIDNVKAKGADGKLKSVPGLTLKITE